MNTRALRSDLFLLLTACIWGFAFVAQRKGMNYMGPFTYNGIRFLLGSLSLLPLILFRRQKALPGTALKAALFVRSSFIAGLCLFIAASLQQIGILYTTEGHSGFITGTYVVLTPIFGIFLGRKTGIPTWIGAGFTLTGLYFLSVAGAMGRINPGDLITLVSAVFWTLHILVIDRLVRQIDPVMLSSGQFAWCALFSLASALCIGLGLPAGPITEQFSLAGVYGGIIPLLYGGLCSVGIAYTLQVAAQKDAPPAHATIILCLEGVFAAIGGLIFSGNELGRFTLLGFILMFCGMFSTQWEIIRGKTG
ncbi:MAG: DMT family transporter [Treponema sp.]|jgi:drug/metabolite transporter (DMT)-like permease|nr:DMT family transporter [Treponema sp.]